MYVSLIILHVPLIEVQPFEIISAQSLRYLWRPKDMRDDYRDKTDEF